MKSYLLKLHGREVGPHPEAQVAQMFADQQINRSTPCKPATSGEWKTVDDYLPTLKYGTQLPAPSSSSAVSTSTPPLRGATVTIGDVNIPFGSVLKMAFKIFGAWLIVGVCFAPVAIIIWFVVLAVIMSFFGHAFSGSHP